MGWKKKVTIFIGQNRDNPIIKKIAYVCKKIYFAYENQNYWVDYNGEGMILERLTKNHDVKVVFDVGANVGYYALLLTRTFPKAKIHCFEVIPETFKQLEDRVGNEENIIINNVGLSDSETELEFNFIPDKHWLTSTYEIQDDNTNTQTVKGKLIRGGKYASENNIDVIDFLKIDVEGNEFSVIKGLEELIDNHKIKVIQLEYGLLNVYSDLLKDFYEYFESKDYSIGKIYPKYVDFFPYSPDKEDFIGPNFLAVSNKYPELIDIYKK